MTSTSKTSQWSPFYFTQTLTFVAPHSLEDCLMGLQETQSPALMPMLRLSKRQVRFYDKSRDRVTFSFWQRGYDYMGVHGKFERMDTDHTAVSLEARVPIWFFLALIVLIGGVSVVLNVNFYTCVPIIILFGIGATWIISSNHAQMMHNLQRTLLLES
jgi:hypothetical protein